MSFSEHNSSHNVRWMSPMQPSTWCRPPRVYTQQQPLITVRRVGPQDCQLLIDLLARLSDRSHQLRYMLPRPRAAEALEREARRMLRGATGDYVTLIVLSHNFGASEAWQSASWHSIERSQPAQRSRLVVRDDMQGQGIGTLLSNRLLQAAERLGITTIRADLLAENSASLRLIRRLGIPFRIIPSRGTLQVVLSCDQRGGDSHAR